MSGREEEEKEEEEEERCDEDDSADDADEAVDCSCSGSAAACASSARAFDARKKSTAAMSRQLSSAIRRRRMAKERSLFPLSLCRSVFNFAIQLPFFVLDLSRRPSPHPTPLFSFAPTRAYLRARHLGVIVALLIVYSI